MASTEPTVLHPHHCAYVDRVSAMHWFGGTLGFTIPFRVEPDQRLLCELSMLSPKPLEVKVVTSVQYIALNFGYYPYNAERAEMLHEEIEQLFEDFCDRKVVRYLHTSVSGQLSN